MPKLRVLSGGEVLTILREFGFQKFGQRGSHIKVRRVLEGGQVQSLTVPNHNEIDRGTLHAIYRRHPGSFRRGNYTAGFSRSEAVTHPNVHGQRQYSSSP
jgi:predicted RNA binding protein YcfA (HicA-like mRNA interferase family)